MNIGDIFQQIIQYGPLVGAAVIFGVLVGAAIWLPVGRKHNQEVLRKAQDKFVALASHYLLTPINIIQTATAQLQDSRTITEEARQQLYETIKRGERRLWLITEQLLIAAQLDRGSLKTGVNIVSVSTVVEECVTLMDGFARAKKITVRFTGTLTAVKEARLDGRQLRQVILAILDNAIKFSPEGEIIEVNTTYADGFFSITISDCGIGMRNDVLREATERFSRGTDIYNFDYEGIGLGLYIANALITLQRGSLHIDSRPNRGTAVTIEFPNQ